MRDHDDDFLEKDDLESDEGLNSEQDDEEQTSEEQISEENASGLNDNTEPLQSSGLASVVTNKAKDGIKAVTKKAGLAIVKFIATNPIVLLIIPVVLILFLLFAAAALNESNYKYTAPKCSQITIQYSNEEENPETQDIETFVANMTYSVTKDFEDPDQDLYKAVSIAIRTNAVNESSNCVVIFDGEVDELFDFSILTEDNERYNDIMKALTKTQGVIMVKDNNPIEAEYDNFCYINNDDDYYTLSQENYKVPTNWVEDNVQNWNYKNCPCNANLSDEEHEACWEEENNYDDDDEPDLIYVDGGHGLGMSIYTAYYMSSEEGSSYKTILKTFYGEEWEFRSIKAPKKNGNGSDTGLNGFEYIEPKCTQITTTTKTSESGGQGSGESITLGIDEYIEGVVYHEFRGANDLETFKSLAVAARSYVLATVKDNCTINNSTATQTFTAEEDRKETASAAMIKQAVQATKGLVITKGSILRSEYDAFCYISKDEDNYIISQGEYGEGGQTIPKSWVDANVHSNVYKNCPCNNSSGAPSLCFSSSGKYQDGGHGRGMSQYGSLYLGKTLGWKYQEILKYYYGNDIVLKSIYKGYTGSGSVSTDGTTELHTPLREFLVENSSSMDELNDAILQAVLNAGPGTREGVIAAGTTLLNYMAENFKVRFPYTYGGSHYPIAEVGRSVDEFYGADPEWGTSGSYRTEIDGKVKYYSYYGPDCSAFVVWCIKNGGYNKTMANSSSLKYSVPLTYYRELSEIDPSTVQPGDLIHHPGHIEMVVDVDLTNRVYKTIEASGEEGGVRVGKVAFGRASYSVVYMGGYYDAKQYKTLGFEDAFNRGKLN